MKIETILAHAPQKTFLIQGNDEAFAVLLENAVLQYPMTNAMALSRFTIDHAKQVV